MAAPLSAPGLRRGFRVQAVKRIELSQRWRTKIANKSSPLGVFLTRLHQLLIADQACVSKKAQQGLAHLRLLHW